MPIVNLTPHPINVYTADTPDQATEAELAEGLLTTIPASGRMARLTNRDLGSDHSVDVDGRPVEVEQVEYGQLDGLPEPQPGVKYVVPLVTALAARREDLLVPHYQVRNEQGTVVGCKKFGRIV